jgi:ATP-dependent DNA helicase DinG
LSGAERFTAAAAAHLRRVIAEADGNEVLAIGRSGGDYAVAEIGVAARGSADRVPALKPHLERGDVVVHNHPSGSLHPSAADLQVATQLGNQGIGFYIVDNAVERVYAVAEPVSRRRRGALDATALARHLEPGGTLSREYAGYEERASQVGMLRFVAEAYNAADLRIAEAGTGVGKSLAYLIPSFDWILGNDERVVVSTATINLQQQLLQKDIPLVVRLLGKDPGCSLVKGRGNFLCLTRLHEALEEDSLFGEEGAGPSEEGKGLGAIERWAASTPTGSRSDLSFYPSEELWSRVCSEADACHGLRCGRREDCFVLKARREAAASRLLVTNHHLLFSDLSLRLSGLGFDASAVLPAFQHIVFDEAHNLERSATSYFSEQFSRVQVGKYISRLYSEKRGRRGGLLLALQRLFPARGEMSELRRSVRAVSDAAAFLDAQAVSLLGGEGSRRMVPHEPETPAGGASALSEPLRELAARIDVLGPAFEGLWAAKDAQDAHDAQAAEGAEHPVVFESKLQLRRLAHVGDLCRRFCRFRDNVEDVHWLESRRSFRGETYARFVITPLDIAPVLREAVYEPYQTVLFTSATLTVSGRFDYWKHRLGLTRIRHREVAEAVFPSPFNYNERVFLGVPADAPEPDEEGFSDFVAQFVREALLISEGRALVLFTSYALLEQTCAAVAPALREAGIPVLRQGEDDRARLLDRFRENTASVLMATDSFWEGVDAPGQALELVIVARLPFRVPSDPVLQARMEAIEAAGGNPFWELALPDAIIRLRQGFGRLMRRSDDRGAVLILDSRIARKRYGSYFLESLPPTRTVISSRRVVLDSLENFIVEMRAGTGEFKASPAL